MFDTHFGPKAQSKHPIEGSFCVTVIYTSFQLAWFPPVSGYDFHPLPDFHSFLNIFHIITFKKPDQQIDIFKISKVKEFAGHHKQLYLQNEEVDEM